MTSGDVTTYTAMVVDLVKEGLGLFSEWPLNIAVIAGLLAVGIHLVSAFIPRRTR